MRNPARRQSFLAFNPFRGRQRKRPPARPFLAAETLEDRTLLTAYVVDTATDAVAVDGLVSLREAIQAANTDTAVNEAAAGMADGDTITFDVSLTGTTITLLLGEFSITQDLVISGIGRGITIDANDLSRIFNIATADNVVIAGLTLTDGGVADSGGAISVSGGGRTRLDTVTITSSLAAGAGGGAVFAHSSELVIVNSTLSGNTASGIAGAGGAIFVGPTAVLTLFNSTVSGNTANRAGGGIEDLSGAGLGVIISGSNLINNNAGVAPAAGNPGDGGALHVTGAGDVSITGGVISGNRAARSGGALYNDTGRMTISGTLIDSNTASGAASTDGGGAIFKNAGVLNVGGQAIISNNSANGAAGRGGGIYSKAGGTTINSVTFRRNTANGAGGGIELVIGVMNFTLSGLFQNMAGATATAATGDGGGVHVSGAGTAILRLSEVRENIAAVEGGGVWGAAASTLRVLGSLVTVNVANGAVATDGGGGVFNNGGSLAIINSAVTENRANGAAGRGGGVHSTGGTVLVNRSTIARNVANGAGGGIAINQLTQSYVDIDHSFLNANIAGLGAAANPGFGGAVYVDGTASGPVFIRRSDVVNNIARRQGAGLWNGDGGQMFVFLSAVGSNFANGSAASDGGGGIYNRGELTVTRSSISENRAAPAVGTSATGGGILSVGGSVTLNSANVSRNVAAKSGGGLRITGGTADVNTSTISDNISGQAPPSSTFAGDGGGVSAVGNGTTVTFRSSAVTRNSAGAVGSGAFGGGVFVASGARVTLVSCSVTGNQATLGGGVYNLGGILESVLSDLLSNRAGAGGGVYNAANSTATLRNSNVASNVATNIGGGLFNGGTLTLTEGTRVHDNTAVTAGGGLFTDAGGTSDVDLALIFDNEPDNVAGPGAVI